MPGNRWELLERASAFAALVTAIAAIGISLYDAKITRDQQRLSVWPYLLQENTHPGAGAPYRRLVINAGLGPALIRSFEYRIAGRRVDQRALTRTLTQPLSGFRSVHSDLEPGIVILPGDTVAVLRIEPPAGDSAYAREASYTTRACYCSLYHECWISDTALGVDPRLVPACPTDSAR